MGLGTGRGRVAPGDAPWKRRAHEPSPPRFTLVRGETLIALVPDDENSAWSLVVTREGPGRLRLEPREKARALIADAPRVSSREVYGCAGAIRTPSGVHLLVISRCKSVGAVRGCPVFRAVAFDAAPCAAPGALQALSPEARRDERDRLGLLRKALDPKATRLFFSGDPARYDCTRSRARAATPEGPPGPTRDAPERDAAFSKTPWFAADRAFAWNARCGDVFLSEIDRSFSDVTTDTMRVSEIKKRRDAASAFLAPLACGAWRSARVAVGETGGASGRRGEEDAFAVVGAVVSVVARVARARHGVRHHCRGADADGNVANFVETEQMLEVETDRARRFQGASADAPVAGLKKKSRGEDDDDDDSRIVRRESYVSCFVITRGSAPVRWAQPLRDMRWRFPMAFLEDASASAASARAHLGAFARRYGASVALDLLKRSASSSESRLGASYAAAAHAAETHVRLVSFDLSNAIARLGDREALATLLRLTETDAARHGFWFDSTPVSVGASAASAARAFPEKTHAQTGAFRVNCKDCLDRTNVVQAALAFRALQSQLRVNAFVGSNPAALKKTHGALWSAHGDDVALLYARTRALRRDVVGSGRRSALGALADARVAVRRWWQSKFSDGEAQDAARFFTSGGELFEASGHAPERSEPKKKTEEENARDDEVPDETTRGARAAAPRRGFFFSEWFSCLRLNQPRVVHADDAWALEALEDGRRGGSKARVASAHAPASEGGE